MVVKGIMVFIKDLSDNLIEQIDQNKPLFIQSQNIVTHIQKKQFLCALFEQTGFVAALGMGPFKCYIMLFSANLTPTHPLVTLITLGCWYC